MDAVTLTLNMVAQLRLADKSASAEVGTPERKLFESASEVIASAYVDYTMLNQQHDIDSMVGSRLDSYLGGVFSFGRTGGTVATGTVTFSRNSPSVDGVIIPAGTLVKSTITAADGSTTTPVTFSTVKTVVMAANTSSVDAPIQCTTVGEIGNVDAESVNAFAGLNVPDGVTSVTNDQPTRGGTNAEGDAAYRTRFKNTFLRNMAGTESQYLSIAVSAPTVTKAMVVGAVSRFREFVQVPTSNDAGQRTQVFNGAASVASAAYTAGGYDDKTATNENFKNKRTTAPSVQPYAKYIYQDQSFLTDGDFDPATSVFYRPYVDFVFNSIPVAAQVDVWQVATTYAVGQLVKATASNGADGTRKVMVATTAGTSHATTEPTWPALNGTVVDNSAITWKYVSTVGHQTLNLYQRNQPNVTILGRGASGTPVFATGLTSGGLALLEYAYMSKASRNNYTAGITNCVDVYVNGGTPQTASSVHVTPDAGHAVQATDAGLWTYNLYGQSSADANVINWRRKIDSNVAAVGNWIMPLHWQPALDAPQSITIDNNTFYRANFRDPSGGMYYNKKSAAGVYSVRAHYIFVEEINGLAGTVRARNGIEWFLSGHNYLPGKIPGDTSLSYTGGGKLIDDGFFSSKLMTCSNYLYDSNVQTLQVAMESNKQATTDVLVHRAKYRYFKSYLTVAYDRGANPAAVNVAIDAALGAYFANQYFGATIQLSDILQAVHNVPGVDNVRWTVDRKWDTLLSWKKSTTYSLGDVVKPSSSLQNNYYFVTTTAGVSGSGSEPTWTSDGTTTVVNGGVTFTPIFAARVEEVNADGTARDQFYNRFYNDDFYLMDDELPAAPSSNVSAVAQRAQNTFAQV